MINEVVRIAPLPSRRLETKSRLEMPRRSSYNALMPFSSGIEFLFLGSGTSAGVPMIGCHCPVCTSTDPHDKRMRPSVVISYQGRRVLVDTTPELRLQCIAQGVDMIDAV